MRRTESDAIGIKQVEVISEEETGRGWRSRVRLGWADGEVTEHEVSLSWADHDHLSGGTVPPAETLRRAMRIAAGSLNRSSMPQKLDLSTLRRLVPGLDDRFLGTDEA